MNQVGISEPTGIPNKEYIETLGGNYIVVNNKDQTVEGGDKNVFGYLGDSAVILHPELMEEPTDNGLTFSVDHWFTPPRSDIYSRLTSYKVFLDLMTKAGLYDPKAYRFPFLSEGEFYTIFVPTDQALIDSGADLLAIDELEKMIKYHFVKSHIIFTDGKKASGPYATMRIDESSTPYTTRYSSLDIRTSADLIEILDGKGQAIVEIPEEDGKTNIFVATDTDKTSGSVFDYITTGVIHEIDRVLEKQ